MVLALVGASAVYAATAARPAANDQHATSNTATASASVAAPVNIPDSAYPYPANAIFVAPGGNDAGAGTVGDPYATVAHAIAVAPSGATIVLRGGVYREALGAVTKPITLQSYPHEQAWLSGSVVVNGWTPALGATAWAHTGWTTQFCQTCFDPNAIVAAYPTAGLPDMVFINGRELAQVTSLAAVRPGTFFVDYNAQTLYVGDDPTGAGTTVEAAAQSQAAMFNPARREAWSAASASRSTRPRTTPGRIRRWWSTTPRRTWTSSATRSCGARHAASRCTPPACR